MKNFAYEVTDKNGNTERFGWYDKKLIEEANRELIFICRKL
ncbi:hypothetical protein [Paenibacillus popilliae]|uniref:Predicted molecular chaperone n=1 Tax=Paenibacillus popilliae ATCC 14706 TaxID=1212764 RepID=M9M4J7_PAEPP|nr:hypothetical protein [Paenibacillus popilliae]GAC44019.1 predicted molecular chaperone [Paenibacillus popilliae ATCC 14706]